MRSGRMGSLLTGGDGAWRRGKLSLSRRRESPEMKRGQGLVWHWGLALSSEQAVAVSVMGRPWKCLAQSFLGLLLLLSL